MSAWGDIKHFLPSEFDSPDYPGSGMLRMDNSLIQRLEVLRVASDFPFIVTSGYRTLEHNAACEGSVDGSAHCAGLAVDIAVGDSRRRFKLLQAALTTGWRRVGIGQRFIHLDTDPVKPQDVLWVYR